MESDQSLTDISGLEVTAGWLLVAICFEGHPVEVHGLNPWTAGEWVPQNERIVVAHPSYPAQRHAMWAYEFETPLDPKRFAAGEFSNGVWGFFVDEATLDQTKSE